MYSGGFGLTYMGPTNNKDTYVAQACRPAACALGVRKLCLRLGDIARAHALHCTHSGQDAYYFVFVDLALGRFFE